MIGIILFTHNDLARGLLAVTEHVLGTRPEQLEVVAVDYREPPERLTERLRASVGRLDQGEGVLIFTDLYGATHTNAACRVVQRGHIELVSGVSAPLLLRALNHRDLSLPTLTDRIVADAGQCVVCAHDRPRVAEGGR